MSKDKALLNSQIRFSEVRCIGEDGEQLGIMSSRDAYLQAQDRKLDLVCISPTAKPPVCKIMDYGKYRYQVEKKQKEARKKQKQIEIKEIKLSTQIAQNDINYKVKHAREFIQSGKHVKFRVFLRGREMSDPSGAFNILEKVVKMVEDIGRIEKEAKVENRYVSVLILPLKTDKKS